GTTFTCVAYMQTSKIVEVASNLHGSKITPSVVHYGIDRILVGEDAEAMRRKDSRNTIFQIKRIMGREADDDEIKKRTYPFEATKDAVEIAGLKVLRIVNEPTAAALAYGFDKMSKSQSRTVLVYDLGGGTFDVSIVKMSGTEADVLSTRGLTYLGGEDFDFRLYQEAVAEFMMMGVEIPENEEFTLLESCEQAKRTLSTCESAEIETITSRGEQQSFQIERETFEDLGQDLFEKTIDCVKDAIKDSGCSMNAIDDVVLVGGSSRIPRFQELLQKAFSNKKLKFDIPPDHAVAHGAAILAESLSESANVSVRRSENMGGAVKLIDVTPFSLKTTVTHTRSVHGTSPDLIGDRMQVLIKKNTRYPTKHTEVFHNAIDDQKAILFEVQLSAMTF
ncbi:hypothetical protein PENTCL1PPCAC_5882, partial [Pristionchus entomophagus]